MEPPTVAERASEPFLKGLIHCADHLSDDEILEIVRSRAGEAELNDLLRHAVNRLVRRDGWIVEREVSDAKHGLTRVDLVLSGPSGIRFAFVEAKLKYASDAIDAPEVFLDGGNSITRDLDKLKASNIDTPRFLLTWIPYVAHSVLPLRYGAGHSRDDNGWQLRRGLGECRDATHALLSGLGRTRMSTVKSGTGDYGTVTLDAWWTEV